MKQIIFCFMSGKCNWGNFPSKMQYVKSHYLEKIDEKVFYELLCNKKVQIFPEKIFFLCVDLTSDLTMGIQDYQFLSDYV